MRPGEVKCKHYLRFGSCKYGEACKFDHPPEEKGTEVERPPEERYEVAHSACVAYEAAAYEACAAQEVAQRMRREVDADNRVI
jgi:hypothetical protein